MKKELGLLLGTLVIIITFSIIFVPQSTVHAAINDGTFDINYEVKEAGNDNTSIADGYFSKPATLTVTDGVQSIQLTVTSSSMIKSLSAPSGPVEVVSEDEGDETRTVKFRVNGDLSQPVPMDMHIIVPDLYDMEHTARLVFDVSGLDTGSENEESTDNQTEKKAPDNDEADKSTEDNNENADNSADNNSENEKVKASENNDDEKNNNEEKEEEEIEKADSALSTDSFGQKVKSDANTSASSIYWISSIILGLLIIAGVVFWIIRKKNK